MRFDVYRKGGRAVNGVPSQHPANPLIRFQGKNDLYFTLAKGDRFLSTKIPIEENLIIRQTYYDTKEIWIADFCVLTRDRLKLT